MEPHIPIGFSQDISKLYNSIKTEDGLIDEMTKEPNHLLAYFEQACNSENQWHLNKPEIVTDLCSRISTLNVEHQLNTEQRQKIDTIIGGIFPTSSEDMRGELATLFDSTLDKDNVVNQLKLSLEQQLPELQQKCVEFIEKETEMKISIEDSKVVSVEINDFTSLNGLTQNYILPLAALGEFGLELTPPDTLDLNELESFLEVHGKSITKLNLSGYRDSIDNSHIKKIINNCPNLLHFSLKSNTVTSEGLQGLGSLANLQILNLSWCEGLTSLPESLGSLKRLQVLNLSYCRALTSLPKSLGGLENLQKLVLSGGACLTSLPDPLGGLKSLQVLDLSHCKALTSLPVSLDGLENLQKLNLTHCAGLTSLPESLGGLKSLQVLNLSMCAGLTSLPESLGGLKSLQVLDLLFCIKLTSLPESFGDLKSLQRLNLSGCEGLTTLPDWLGKLSNLQALELLGCHLLTSLPESLGGLENLQSLDFSWCTGLTSLPDTLGSLERLQVLVLSRCSQLDDSSRIAFFKKMVGVNFERGLEFYKNLEIQADEEVGEWIAKQPYDKIKSNLPALIGLLSREALIPITLALAENDFDTLVENANQLPLIDISPEELEKSPKLKEFLSSKINEITAWQTTVQVNEVSLDKVPDIKLSRLLELFDNINFEDPEKPGYRDPNKLTIDGVPATIEGLREGIQKLLNRIEIKEAYVAVPSDPEERELWYQKLENLLKVVTKKLEEEEEPGLVADGLLSLGTAGHQCGSRWIGESSDVKKSLEGAWQEESVEAVLQSWNDSYKEGILQGLTLEYTPRVGRSYQPHIFNLAATTFAENKVALPSRVDFDPNDTLMPTESIEKAEIMERLQDFYSPLAVAKYYQGKIEDGSSDIKGKVIGSLRDYAEKNLLEKTEHAKEKERFDKMKDLSMKMSVLEDVLDNEGLLNYDDATDAYHVTVSGAMGLLKHFEYFS